jgi:hypothetical protein
VQVKRKLELKKPGATPFEWIRSCRAGGLIMKKDGNLDRKTDYFALFFESCVV